MAVGLGIRKISVNRDPLSLSKMKVRLDSGKLYSDLHSLAYLQSHTIKKEKEEGGGSKVKRGGEKINKSKHIF